MSGEEKEKIKILHVANISSAATRDHIYNMFNYLGKIQEMKVYPSEGNITSNTLLKTAFIKFDDERCAEVGQHLTNTVLIDCAIVCLPHPNPNIPDEESFFNSGGSTTAGQRQLPPHVTNKIQETEDGNAVLRFSRLFHEGSLQTTIPRSRQEAMPRRFSSARCPVLCL
uniref:RRM domain-containing protein n=1 Tax=Caenorhabditis japonica TaxID=281687 RepID=A0A8R1EIU6_CAEJA